MRNAKVRTFCLSLSSRTFRGFAILVAAILLFLNVLDGDFVNSSLVAFFKFFASIASTSFTGTCFAFKAVMAFAFSFNCSKSFWAASDLTTLSSTSGMSFSSLTSGLTALVTICLISCCRLGPKSLNDFFGAPFRVNDNSWNVRCNLPENTWRSE